MYISSIYAIIDINVIMRHIEGVIFEKCLCWT